MQSAPEADAYIDSIIYQILDEAGFENGLDFNENNSLDSISGKAKKWLSDNRDAVTARIEEQIIRDNNAKLKTPNMPQLF